jgi:A/G-specific adenine glycosylase
MAGAFPEDHATILEPARRGPLHGRSAVASFAFGQAQPIVDGNVARVLSRIFNDPTPIDSPQGRDVLWKRATELVQATDDPRALNSALMELGQTHCRTGRPDCEACPVRTQCRATEPEIAACERRPSRC